MLVLRFRRVGTDHVAQIDSPGRQPALGAAIHTRCLKARLPQVTVLVHPEQEAVERRAHEPVDPLLRWRIEPHVDLPTVDTAFVVDDISECFVDVCQHHCSSWARRCIPCAEPGLYLPVRKKISCLYVKALVSTDR